MTSREQLEHYERKLAYETDPSDVQAMLEAGTPLTIIDTRSPEAYAREHVPGALSIPHRTMNEGTTAGVDRGALVVTYCDGIGCNGSTKGAIAMLKLGFRVKEMMGGLDWWKRDGLKTVKRKR